MTNGIYRNGLLSKSIEALRFPMCVLVVFIHARAMEHFVDGKFAVFDFTSRAISNIIASSAVPMFFLISGFFFYYSIDCFSWRVYFNKLKSRGRTILLPYIAWNLLIVLSLLFAQKFLGNSFFAGHRQVLQYGSTDWVSVFWGSDEFWGNPIDFPLWFIRDLMVVMVLSPVLYCFVKYLKIYGLAVLSILWIFGLSIPVTGLEIRAVLFFSIGMFLGINKIDFISKILRLHRFPLTCLYFFSIALIFILRSNYVFLNLSILLGVILMISLIAWMVEKNTHPKIIQSKFLASSTFFIFAFHGFPLEFIQKRLISVFNANTSFGCILVYFCSVVIVVVVGLILYYFVNKTKYVKMILTGNR